MNLTQVEYFEFNENNEYKIGKKKELIALIEKNYKYRKKEKKYLDSISHTYDYLLEHKNNITNQTFEFSIWDYLESKLEKNIKNRVYNFTLIKVCAFFMHYNNLIELYKLQ